MHILASLSTTLLAFSLSFKKTSREIMGIEKYALNANDLHINKLVIVSVLIINK